MSKRAQELAALAVVVGAAAWIAFSQPFSDPWWIYADADATYTASGLNLAAGRHADYVDHPGLPIEEVLAGTFGVQAIYERIAHGTRRGAFADDRLLHLDKTRPVFRGWAIAFFLAGAGLTFLVLRSLLGHWLWGLAGGLLWLGAPDGATDAIQIRPEVLLSGLCLLVGFLIARAYERRSAWIFALAAIVLGLTATVKVHAAALLVPLALAALLGHPSSGWGQQLRDDLAGAIRRRRGLVAVGIALWLAVAIVSNWTHVPFSPSRHQKTIVLAAVVLVGGYGLVSILVHARSGNRWAKRLLDPFFGLLAAGVALGVAIPITFVLDDGLRALASMVNTLSGRGVNRGIEPFQLTFDQFTSFPLKQAAVVFVLAGIAALVGVWRRDPWPGIWFAGALTLGIMAAARLSVVRYYAPVLVFSIPAALWLCRRSGRVGSVLVWLLVAYVVVPQIQHRSSNARAAGRDLRVNAAIERVGALLRKPDEIVVTADYAPVGDTRFFNVVESFTKHVPRYPYRFFPDVALHEARARGLVPRYYAGPTPFIVTRPQTMSLGGEPFRVRPIPRLSTPEVTALELMPASRR